MKVVFYKIAIFFVSVLILASCTDGDTFPEGGVFTSEQKIEIAEKLPERLSADVNGMYAIMSKQFSVFPSSGRHDDFGYPMACLSADLNGADMVATDDNYNWFSVASSYEDRTYTYANPYMRWAIFYNQIKLANDILAAIPENTDNDLLKYYRGQALAVRAFDYLNLVQMFQFNYKGHENEPAVPIITHNMEGDPSTNPRATVKSVYELILSDLNASIELLDGYQRTSKGFIDQQVAYGIRARAHLIMQNYAEAASDAAAARANYNFLSKEEVSTPGFNDASASSWMWALIINPNNIESPLASWPSKLCSFSGNGYATGAGTYKMINTLLWSKIPESDVRKGWWVDEELKSPLIDDKSWPGFEGQPIGPLSIEDVKVPFLPYTNVKFGPYNNEFGNSENASDWVIMRAEEMLFIEAEGLAMSGNFSAGKSLLEDFVKNYRDPNYVCNAATEEELQNEIWFQRRVELWGEGFAFSDIMRLQKNIVRFNNRIETNHPEAFKFNISSNDGWLLLRIPQREINGNNGISESDNNSEGSLPQSGDGAGLTDGVTD